LLISGGAPLPPSFFLAAAGFNRQGADDQASPVVSVNLRPHQDGHRGTSDQSVEVRTAPDGELLVRGPNVMSGYYKLGRDARGGR
jgi:long-chain acyl-CoA synthetase